MRLGPGLICWSKEHPSDCGPLHKSWGSVNTHTHTHTHTPTGVCSQRYAVLSLSSPLLSTPLLSSPFISSPLLSSPLLSSPPDYSNSHDHTGVQTQPFCCVRSPPLLSSPRPLPAPLCSH